jgi:AcrR family transcriptional regulator
MARATALPAEERRAAIVAAALPLLLEQGAGVTTRQIAEAAGIAEGTIFRVFADKTALIDAVVEAAFDPAPTAAALADIDLGLALEPRLTEATEVLQRRVATIWQLMTAVGMTKPPTAPSDAAARRQSPEMVALAALFVPDARRLRLDPLEAAERLRGLTFACSHPALIAGEPSTPAEIVSLLLDGIRRPER